MGCIYMITNKVNDKKYIGLTRRPLSVRWQGHKDRAHKENPREGTISWAISKFGADTFNIQVIEEVDDLDLLSERERHWIEYYGTLTPFGYNQNRGGSLALTPVTHTIDGVEYRGYGMIADAFGLLEETVRARFLAGWTAEQAAGLHPPPESKPRKGRSYVVEGVEYANERDLAREYDIPIEKFRARLHAMGWTLEEALEITDRIGNKVIVKDKVFSDLKAASDHYNLNYSTVSSRKKRGWSILQCLGLEAPPPKKRVSAPTERRHHFPLTIGGKTYYNSNEVAADCDVTAGTIRYRLSRNWPVEELMGKPNSKPQGKPIQVGNANYPSLSEACRVLGKSLRTINSRLNYGWTIDEAFELAKREEQFLYEYEVRDSKGQVYRTNNLSSFCREHGLRNQSNLLQTFSSPKHHSYRGYSLIKQTPLKANPKK